MKVLVLGGTGAMGVYLVDELLGMGHEVVVTTRSNHDDNREGLSYVIGNAREESFLTQAIAGAHFDAVVDFMARPAAEFEKYLPTLTPSTEQYVYLSSYRVYADSPYITEDSPRLLDVCEDEGYLATNEYALDKARCEDMLKNSGNKNWTVVRPSVTFSRARFQLGTLEAEDWLWRWEKGLEVPLSPEMLKRQATMTWGGDASWFIAHLIGNDAAMGEIFNICTSEHQPWYDVLETYQSVLPKPLNVRAVSAADYQRITADHNFKYDRMYNRILSNEKVLAATGRKQGDLKPMNQALASELSAFLEEGIPIKTPSGSRQARMDRYLGIRQNARQFGEGANHYRLWRDLPLPLLRKLRPNPPYLCM